MGVIIYSFNLNISPKVSYGVLECDTVIVIELHAYDFVIKRGVICAACCIFFFYSTFYGIICSLSNFEMDT